MSVMGYAAIGTDGTRPVVWAVGVTEAACARDLKAQSDPGETQTVRASLEAIKLVRRGEVAVAIETGRQHRSENFLAPLHLRSDDELHVSGNGLVVGRAGCGW